MKQKLQHARSSLSINWQEIVTVVTQQHTITCIKTTKKTINIPETIS